MRAGQPSLSRMPFCSHPAPATKRLHGGSITRLWNIAPSKYATKTLEHKQLDVPRVSFHDSLNMVNRSRTEQAQGRIYWRSGRLHDYGGYRTVVTRATATYRNGMTNKIPGKGMGETNTLLVCLERGQVGESISMEDRVRERCLHRRKKGEPES